MSNIVSTLLWHVFGVALKSLILHKHAQTTLATLNLRHMTTCRVARVKAAHAHSVMIKKPCSRSIIMPLSVPHAPLFCTGTSIIMQQNNVGILLVDALADTVVRVQNYNPCYSRNEHGIISSVTSVVLQRTRVRTQ